MATNDETGRVLDVDPKTLAIATNVRATVTLDDEFVASIRERGVLEPVLAYRDDDGTLTVHRGQRRTLAAIKVERPTIPVVVTPRPDTDADRVIDQIIENVHRAGMTAGDLARGVEQLAAFGITEAQIVKRSALPRAQVRAALGTARSELATKAGGRYDFLTLEHTAALAEFEDDTDAVKALTKAARDGGFEHTLQRVRDERAERLAKETLLAELAEKGTRVIDRPGYDDPAAALYRLDIDEAEHPSCPGHAVYLEITWVEGPDGRRTKRTWVAAAACTDPKTHGHQWKKGFAPTATARPKGPMADEEKAARRELIANNKAWASACTVRRSWLVELVKRKTPPQGVELFIYRELLHCPHQLGNALDAWGGKGAGHRGFRDVMGLDRDAAAGSPIGSLTIRGELDELLAASDRMPPKRATLLTAAMVLAAWHHTAGPSVWREPSDQDARILQQMHAWGYPLADVEALALQRYEERKKAGSADAASLTAEDDTDEPENDE